jgi:hypothetical protein
MIGISVKNCRSPVPYHHMVFERFEREESYHLGLGMRISATRETSVKATSGVEKSSECGIEIRNSHCLSALAEALVGNFQRAVAQQIIIERGGMGVECAYQ